MYESTPKFLQGIVPFSGDGYDAPTVLAAYTIDPAKRAQPVYLRAGNSCDAMIVISLACDGKVIRLFPIGASGASHVPLAVVEDIPPETVLELLVSAPSGIEGTVAFDFGIVEI